MTSIETVSPDIVSAVDIDDRGTPDALFRWCEGQWGPFTLDVAASAANAKCRRFVTREQNGLARCWDGERIWCNPPFSDLSPWVEKAWDSSADVVVMLLPANRTDQRWWHKHIEPFRDRVGSRLTIRFAQSRPRFVSPTKKADSPKFGVVFAIWGARPVGSGA